MNALQLHSHSFVPGTVSARRWQARAAVRKTALTPPLCRHRSPRSSFPSDHYFAAVGTCAMSDMALHIAVIPHTTFSLAEAGRV